MIKLAQSAFGAATTLSKADPPRRQITGPPTNETGRNIGPSGAAPKGRTGRPRITSMPPKYEPKGNAKEFLRGAKGSAKGQVWNATRADNTPNAKVYRKLALKRAIDSNRAGSPHSAAFSSGAKAGGATGAAAGKAARTYLKHPNATAYGVAGLAVGGSLAIRRVKEGREARERLEAKRAASQTTAVSKIRNEVAAAGLVGGAMLGGLAIGNEASRRISNKRGAGITPLEPYRHPIRTQHKTSSATWSNSHKYALKRVARNEEKARAHPDSVKGERKLVRAEAWRNNANVAAYNSRVFRRASDVGSRKARKEAGKYDEKKRYTVPKPVSKSLPHGEQPVRTELPGDNRDAQMARSRRKVGLGTAGVGYLAATRGKDVAPAVADAATPKFLNGAKHADRVARRTKFITGASSKVGGAAVIGGLALAGEGAVSDLRNRKAFSRTHQQAKEKVHQKLNKSAFGVEHDNEVSKAGFGDLLSGVTKPVASGADKLSARLKPLAAPATTAGSTVKATGAQPIIDSTKAAALKPATTKVTKAYDSERARHSRQEMYAGGAAGGAVLATGGAAVSGRAAAKTRQAAGRAATRATTAQGKVRTNLADMSQPAKTGGKPRSVRNIKDTAKLHEMGSRSSRIATELGGKARRLTRVSAGSALGAAALGAAAYGAHNYDRRRVGSYGY